MSMSNGYHDYSQQGQSQGGQGRGGQSEWETVRSVPLVRISYAKREKAVFIEHSLSRHTTKNWQNENTRVARQWWNSQSNCWSYGSGSGMIPNSVIKVLARYRVFEMLGAYLEQNGSFDGWAFQEFDVDTGPYQQAQQASQPQPQVSQQQPTPPAPPPLIPQPQPTQQQINFPASPPPAPAYVQQPAAPPQGQQAQPGQPQPLPPNYFQQPDQQPVQPPLPMVNNFMSNPAPQENVGSDHPF